jgi:hypothetical protein
MSQERAVESAEKTITKLTRERRSDPLDDETAQLHSEPIRARLRVHRRYGWPDDEAQKEI